MVTSDSPIPTPRLKVGILSQWYDPEPGASSLPGVLARGLVAKGHEVQVVTGFPNYPHGRIYDGYTQHRRVDQELDGVQVRRVALYPSHDDSFVRRSANYASFALSALGSGMGPLKDVDAFWVYNSPATVALPMWWTRYVHNKPFVLHIMDLWPDSLFVSGFVKPSRTSNALDRAVTAWCNGMYASSSAVCYITPGTGRILAERGVPTEKLRYVPAWTDESVFKPSPPDMRAELGVADDQVTLLYAGALGEQQGLDTLVDACARVRDPRFVCLIAGAGVSEQRLRDRAQELQLTNLRFIGSFPKPEMTRLMAVGDVHFVGLHTSPLSKATLPSKIQATLASAKPMIVAVEGDAADVAAESGAGFPVAPGDPYELARTMETVTSMGRGELARLGTIARDYYERTFSADVAINKIEALLYQAVATPTRRGRRARRADRQAG